MLPPQMHFAGSWDYAWSLLAEEPYGSNDVLITIGDPSSG